MNITNSATVIAHKAIPNHQVMLNNTDDNLFSGLNLALNCQLSDDHLTCLVGMYRPQLRAYLLMLAGIDKPMAGQVNVLGNIISELNQQQWQKLRRQIGYLSGMAPLHSTRHSLMNVMLPALYHTDLPLHAIIAKVQMRLDELNCRFELTAFPLQLSRLQQSQLALARALILDPLLLILDVPFNNLSVKEHEKMGELLAMCQHNRTVCMIGGLQYPHFLEHYAKQIIFISTHEIIKFNGWQSFIQADNAEIQALLGAL